jgi:large subunit ribosomal protein L34
MFRSTRPRASLSAWPNRYGDGRRDQDDRAEPQAGLKQVSRGLAFCRAKTDMKTDTTDNRAVGTFQPNRRKRSKKHGFRTRMKTQGGKKVRRSGSDIGTPDRFANRRCSGARYFAEYQSASRGRIPSLPSTRSRSRKSMVFSFGSISAERTSGS